MDDEKLIPETIPETLAQTERSEAIAATADDLSALAAHEEGVSLLSAHLEEEFPNSAPPQVREGVEYALEKLGFERVSVGDLDPLIPRLTQILAAFLENAATENEHSQEKSKEHTRLSLQYRLQSLHKEGMGLQATLKTLRSEFADRLDKETDAVLGQYEALFSPAVLPDEKERAAVESLFLSQPVSDFSAGSFTAFVYTIYDQPEEAISEETKQRIERKFQIPRQRIETAGELAKATFATNEDGTFLHDSPENALVLENGMSTYVNPDGEAVITVIRPESEPEIIYVQSQRNWVSDSTALRLNYAVLRKTIDKEWGATTGLFGDAQEEYDWQAPKREEACIRANRFIHLLIGHREPNYFLQIEDMGPLRRSLRCLVNPQSHTEVERFNDLRELGILRGESFDWNRLETIGHILRQNDHFRTQALKDPSAPFRLLTEKLVTLDHHAQ